MINSKLFFISVLVFTTTVYGQDLVPVPAQMPVPAQTPVQVPAKVQLTLEGGALWQSRNDQAVPGNGGTRFSLSDINSGPFASYRLYVGYQWSDKHQIRVLYAPLELSVSGSFDGNILFQNSTFRSNMETAAFYKFNSYRITYAYGLEDINGWKFALGFTAKVRDAEVRLTQGVISESKKNIGFVPLFHFNGKRSLGPGWLFRFDFDGLAAPQGRAFDIGAFLEKQISEKQIFAFLGYRTVEGGADNAEVYNFAWIHIGTLGFRLGFF